MLTYVMYAYRPISIRSVNTLVENELQQESWRQYMATVAWSFGRMQSKSYPISPYEKPEFKHVQKDNRSGSDIAHGILEKLGGVK